MWIKIIITRDNSKEKKTKIMKINNTVTTPTQSKLQHYGRYSCEMEIRFNALFTAMATALQFPNATR